MTRLFATPVPFRVDKYTMGNPLQCVNEEVLIETLDDLSYVLKSIPQDYDMIVFTSAEACIVMPAEHFQSSVIIPDPTDKPRMH